MSIRREGEFYVWEDVENRPLLGMESSRLEECTREANRRKVYGVFGNPSFGFQETNLDFLKEMPQIHSVWFWEIKLKDINGLYEVPDLASFGVHTDRPPVDFSRLHKLESIVWFYKAKDSGIAALKNVVDLSVWHYKPSHKSFKSLELPVSIRKLELSWANPASLAGLPLLPKLKELEIHRCRNLDTLEGLPEIAPNLEKLLVSTSGTVQVPAGFVKQMSQLRRAWVNEAELI